MKAVSFLVPFIFCACELSDIRDHTVTGTPANSASTASHQAAEILEGSLQGWFAGRSVPEPTPVGASDFWSDAEWDAGYVRLSAVIDRGAEVVLILSLNGASFDGVGDVLIGVTDSSFVEVRACSMEADSFLDEPASGGSIEIHDEGSEMRSVHVRADFCDGREALATFSVKPAQG